jgi:probable HAF family extracellular repeat protein
MTIAELRKLVTALCKYAQFYHGAGSGKPSVSASRLLALAASAVAAVLASTATAAVPTYVAVPIGSDNFGYGINSSAQIVASAGTANSVAFVYTGSVGVSLGALGGSNSYGEGINRFGHATGSASVGGGFDLRAFIYADGKMTGIGSLTPTAISYGKAINDSDQVTGVSYTGVEFIQHAFLYSSGVMVNLGTLDGGYSVGNGINNSGQVVGAADLVGSQRRAFLYSGEGMIDLGTLGGCCSEAFAINDAGLITGHSYLPGNNDRHAFAYANGVMTDLGTLGGTISEGYAINSGGQIVGMSYMLYNSGSPHAFLYDNHALLDLNALVVSGLNGAVLTEARGINENGQIVASSCISALPCQMFRLDPAGQVDPLPPVTITVVEYHNSSFDHYFITPIDTEIALLDAHAPPFQDWSRTGFSFKAYANLNAPIASTPICRFFNNHFAPKSSHFYAPRGSGCEDTLALFPDWGLEDAKLFNTYLPDGTGTCPQGTIRVYRMYNAGMGGAPNHRFTTSVAERQSTLAKGFVPEGAGVGGVGMCVPQ